MAKKTFTRVDRRNAILNTAARRLLNDPAATWNNFAQKFTDAVYPLNVTDEDLTQEKIKAKLKRILSDAIKNLDADKTTGPAQDVLQIGIDFPRLAKKKK